MDAAAALAGGLERLEILVPGDPVRMVHPVVRAALEASMDSGERDAAHRAAARLLHAEGAPPGQVAVHLARVVQAGDPWVVDRLREGARAALDGGAPRSAAAILRRALAEPPPAADRVEVLREAARAAAGAGQETAVALLEEALALVGDADERAEIALEVAEAHSALFRWVDAVDVLERALGEFAAGNGALAARLEGELVVSGLHDARGAGRARPVLERLASRAPTGPAGEALAVAQGMARFITGHPAVETAPALEAALAGARPGVENWDTRAALLWVLVACERFDAVDAALKPLRAEVQRSGSARGLVAVYSTLGLLKLRLGALPEADAAARVALEVLQEGDFAPGLGFAATVLADVALEAGNLDEAQALLELLPAAGWPPGVGTVLIPATRGRLRLAQGRPAEALADFEASMELFGSLEWGMETHETGYVHARSGAALALLRLGERERARSLAEAELADVRVRRTPRAIGVALRAAGLARGGAQGEALLRESVAALRGSPAVLEWAHALATLGGALRRAGHRRDAREPLAEALEIAARCGARPLAARAREELRATGARPRRAWRTGVEALTPRELRVARLAAAGLTNREIAFELYVTLKTVEGHLARAYAKLGIEGRRELAGVLRE
jgi:DNA-binding CsgD family transcriptional regulator